jgi:hypothetical protein
MSLDAIVEETGRRIHEVVTRAALVNDKPFPYTAVDNLIRDAILRDREELVDSLLACLERKPPVKVQEPTPEPKVKPCTTMWPEEPLGPPNPPKGPRLVHRPMPHPIE